MGESSDVTSAPRVRFDDVRARVTRTFLEPRGELRADTLDQVRAVVRDAEAAARDGLWAAGFVAYEAAPAFDAGLAVRNDETTRLPLAWFGLFASCATTPLRLPGARRAHHASTWQVDVEPEEYALRVKSILDEIAAGNAYQVNFTSAVRADRPVDPEALYRRLLLAQRPAYGALIELDGVSVVSASPELFFDWAATTLRSRPMKGTAPRGRWPGEDRQRRHDLVTSPKERAENVMIADLIRNDLGKVARVGTVEVTTLCEAEDYPSVWQMVSEVRCETRDDARLLDVFDAVFPCGSVTGAPKHRAMQIIASREARSRGVYCGAIGVLAPTPDGPRATFSVAIRTATIDPAHATALFGSGGGIVADSVPEAEYRELALKAGLLDSAMGDGFRLLETFRYTPGATNDNVAAHLERLRASADQLGFLAPVDLAQRLARRLESATFDARVRVTLSRGGRVDVEVSPAPAEREPVTLVIDDVPVSSSWPLLFHKTTRRALYDEARRRHPGVDDVVLVNERDECTETTTATLAARFGSAWRTPPLAAGCLPGVERARALAGGRLEEARLTPHDLRAADEIAVLNSLRGWRVAVLVDGEV